MNKHLLAAVALAICPLVATAAGAAPKEEQAKQHKAAKRTAKKPVKPAAKAARKPPAPAVAAKPSTDVNQRLTRAGDYRFAIQHGGLTRTYRVHIPPQYTQSEPAPLLVALHGGGIDRVADDGFDDLARASDYYGFLAAFPDALAPAAKDGKAAWNAGNCCGEAREKKVNDVGFIEQVVRNVFRQTSVDRQRIYATGVSDGGMMAYKLACDLPFVFKAVASVGGTDNTVSCSPGREVSVLHLHARNDPRVPYSGGQVSDGAEGRKQPHLTSAVDTARKWAHLDGCELAPRRVLEQAGAYCEAYTYCRRRTEVRICVTDTGGHSWPGAKARHGAPSPSQTIAGTETMWGFLISH